MNLTDNFTLEEMIHSDIADKNHIDNIPDESIIENLRQLCENVLQPVREKLGEIITVSSGFRNTNVNLLAKGALNSQHVIGQAADLKCFSLGNKVLYDAIKERDIFDQLIWEYGNDDAPQWVHVSYNPNGNRNQELRIK